MRNHLIDQLVKIAENDKNLYLMTGDLGFGVLDEFALKYPDRFINAGISEQNMMAVAAGMALSGNTVYVYSIGNFPGMRCLEQIRNDVCYHNANVKIIVVGGGFAYGQLGMSHHATEDIAVMRALPNMRVYSPADPSEAVEIIKQVQSIDGPCYIRLGKGKEPELHNNIINYDVERILEMSKGEAVAIISTGSIIGEAKKAVETLHEEGIKVGLYNCMTIKPIDSEAIRKIGLEYDIVITVEEHNLIGGLGGAVAEELAEMKGHRAKLIRIGLNDIYPSIVGSQKFLREIYQMSEKYILKRIREVIADEKSCGNRSY